LNWRPSISVLIGIRRTSPVNSQWVCVLSMSDVPSNIYETKKLSNTTILLNSDSKNLESSYLNDCTLSTNFEHLTFTLLPVSKLYVYNFCIPMEFTSKLKFRSAKTRTWNFTLKGWNCANLRTYLGNLTLSRTTSGPSTSRTVL
jgi:hypothetical protein